MKLALKVAVALGFIISSGYMLYEIGLPGRRYDWSRPTAAYFVHAFFFLSLCAIIGASFRKPRDQ